jgi:hypothetical protein
MDEHPFDSPLGDPPSTERELPAGPAWVGTAIAVAGTALILLAYVVTG